MTDHDLDRSTLADQSDDDVRRLLEQAGPRPPLPEEDLASLREAARRAWQGEPGTSAPRASLPPLRWILPLAAALILTLGVAWWATREPATPVAPTSVARVERIVGSPEAIGPDGPLSLSSGAQLAAGTTLVTAAKPSDDRLAIRLPSGVSVRLAAASRLTLASETTVRLDRGAVYVDTGALAIAAAPRITVETPLGVATDVGTQFLVRLEGTEAVSIGVREGEVRLRRNAHEHRAAAGTLLVVDRGGEVSRVDVPAAAPLWDLATESAPPFSGDSLAELLEWTARETGWTVRYAEPGLEEVVARTTVHGSVGALPPDEAAFVVLPGADLEGILEGDVLVVRRL